MKEVLITKINNQLFGINITDALEIIKKQEFTSIPNSTSSMVGITNVRGDIVTILSLSHILGFNNIEDKDMDFFVTVKYNDKKYIFPVEEVLSIKKIEDDEELSIDKVQTFVDTRIINCIIKYDDELVSTLNVNSIIKNIYE